MEKRRNTENNNTNKQNQPFLHFHSVLVQNDTAQGKPIRANLSNKQQEHGFRCEIYVFLDVQHFWRIV
jgi:hypothetical protein